MRVSEFSSIVFSDESYKFDQSYGIKQVFARRDPIRVCVAIDPNSGDQWDEDVVVEFILHSHTHGYDYTAVYGDTGVQTFGNAPDFCVLSVNAFVEDAFGEAGEYTLTIRRTDNRTGEKKKISGNFLYCEDGCDCLKDTMILTYSNKRNIFDTIFRRVSAKTSTYSANSWVYKEYSNIFYGFRFKGSIVERETEYAMDSEIFKDQFSYSRLLSGFKKDKFSLTLGDNWGVSNGMGRLFRNALSCSETYLDGERISLSDGEIEREDIGDTYPFFRFTAKISKEYDPFGKAETYKEINALSLNGDANTLLRLNNSDEIIILNIQ